MQRPRESAPEWRRRVAQWRRSREPAAVFAKRHDWNPRTLTWWASHLQGRAKGREAALPRSSFVEVVERREELATAGTPLEIVLPGVGTVRVSAGTDLVLLRAVVDALGGRE